jgi:hypothetical protein
LLLSGAVALTAFSCHPFESKQAAQFGIAIESSQHRIAVDAEISELPRLAPPAELFA